MTDDLLETLQADVFAVLKNTPALALANVLLNDAETTDSKIENALKTLTSTGGKRGLALVVLRPEITEGEKNLPGPPLTLRIEIQCVEHPLMNRGSDGTGVRSSQAALNALATLHLRHLGDCLLYADKDPIKAVQVKTGFVSDAVTLFAKFSGLVAEKPLAPSAAMAEISSITITGTTGTEGNASANGTIYETGEIGGRKSYAGGGVSTYYLGGKWVITCTGYRAEKVTAALSPIGLDTWTLIRGAGQPTVAAGPAGAQLVLTSPGGTGQVAYTMDGTYPIRPIDLLYIPPPMNLAVGTVVRAVNYVTGLPPSDVLELTVTA
jgi:hypothetical protein